MNAPATTPGGASKAETPAASDKEKAERAKPGVKDASQARAEPTPMPSKRKKAGKPASVTVLGKPVPEVAPPARLRWRHVLVMASFLLCVVLPSAAAFFYLYEIADDQYSSRVSFSIRSEEFRNPLEALGSFGDLSTGSSSDADILDKYLRSQKLLEDIRGEVDLETIYSKPAYDPVFAFKRGQPIEALLDYWKRMAYITFNSSTGLIDIEVFAFTADDAHAIATAVMNASSRLVEELSQIAREDTTKYAAYELDRAQTRLTQVRQEMRDLRDRERIIDPRADLESQMGVLTALQRELATALVDLDLLTGSTREDDPRIVASHRKIDAIEERIEKERDKLGRTSTNDEQAFAAIVGDFESLQADREFAEKAYLGARAAYDSALAEARRKSRYLAAHVPPTMAESAQYPSRLLLGFTVLGFCFVFWTIAVLTLYGMRDRR